MKTAYVSGILFSLVLMGSQDAHALVNLKKIQVTDNAQVDLFFDQKVAPHQIKTEFFNDIIQISLNDVAVYPAKISSIAGAELTKVFAYQYAPKLVRCRLTVKGKAESFQGRLQVKANGKNLSIRITGASAADKISHSAAKSERVSSGAAADASVASGKAESKGLKIGDSEKQLLERVMKTNPPAQADKAEKSEPISKGKGVGEKEKSQALTGNNKPLPSPIRSFAMLGVVLAAFVGVMLLTKRFKGQNLSRAIRSLGIGKKAKMIEVVATHYLGPKKSIAVVKVAGRILVLGVSNDAINLITQLEGDMLEDGDLELSALEGLGLTEPRVTPAASPGAGATSAGNPIFSDILATESTRKPEPAVSTGSSVRARIKSKLEAMKPL